MIFISSISDNKHLIQKIKTEKAVLLLNPIQNYNLF
jgi:hypothetical protein